MGGGGGVDKGGTAIWFKASSLLKKEGAKGGVSCIMETKKTLKDFIIDAERAEPNTHAHTHSVNNESCSSTAVQQLLHSGDSCPF